MNYSALLKTLLPGFIPLFVFIAADALFGEAIGLAVGVATGLFEFVRTLIKDRRADPFVVADTLLLAAAGGLSLLLRDEIFFKLKPAVIELVLAAGLGVLLVLPPAYLTAYMGRVLKGVSVPEAAIPSMRRSLSLMLGALVLHIALTAYAAVFLSNAAWGFVSGGLLYILFGLVALGQFLAARRARGGGRLFRRAKGGEEILPLVDEEGKVVGTAPRSECHRGPGKLHPVVHIHIGDGEGRIYLQKRAMTKDLLPGMWDTSVGGHVSAGEDLEVALMRELREELGVTALALETAGEKPTPIMRYRWDSEAESELVFSFWLRYKGPFAPDPAEVEEGRFWSVGEIRASLGTGVLTPNFEHEFGLLERAQAEARTAPRR